MESTKSGSQPPAGVRAPVVLPPSESETPSKRKRIKHLVFGKPRDLADRSIFHHMALIPFLAWVGLGADGLSSSAYGPEEAFRTLGEHTYLAAGLALLTGFTVFIIASAYSLIIDQFPHGGGGYVVSTKLLGERVGVVSGCALLVDYILTITVSISAAGDAIFSFIPRDGHWWIFHLNEAMWGNMKLALEIVSILLLTTLNIRGVKESVLALTPIFLVFIVTHIALIGSGIFSHVTVLPVVAHNVTSGISHDLSTIGIGGILLLLVHAYSMGGGTYTGIEAVSNGLPIMREPRVRTARRTMLYMGVSLAFTAAGLLLCYLLFNVKPQEGRTLNAVLADALSAKWPMGSTFAFITIFSEGALLVVAAQAGFIDGPRILANMANDSWVPRRFAALSDRLTTRNGVLLMSLAALAALLYTRGDVRHLVVMYSINVFLTFSLSMFAMLRYWVATPDRSKHRKTRIGLFGTGFVMCALILGITIYEKFAVGGWITLLVTSLFIGLCYLIRAHYNSVSAQFKQVDQQLKRLEMLTVGKGIAPGPLDTNQPTAVLLVGSYSGVGIHTILNIHRSFTGYFKNILFVSIGVIDSGAFKGEDEMDALKKNTEAGLQSYVDLSRKLGFQADYRMAMGTEVVIEAERLCLDIAREGGRCVFFTGQVIFRKERWYHKPLHNQTAFAIQKRLQWQGLTMVILPIRVEG